MKKVLCMAVTVILVFGSVGSVSADIVRAKATVVLAGVTANTGDADDVTTIIFATSLDGQWTGTRVFTASGPGNSSVYASALSALSWNAPLLLVVDSDALQAGGQVPILVVYNEPPPINAQAQSQLLDNQQITEPTDLLPELTDLE